MNTWILKELENNPAVEAYTKGKSPITFTSFIQEALLLASSYQKKPRPILVVEKNLYSAQRLYERLCTLLPIEQCVIFSVEESLRVEAIAQSPENLANKVESLSSLLDNPNKIVVTHVSACVRQLPSPELFKDSCIHLKIGQTITLEELKRKLIQSGYSQVSHIDTPLCFASRGGVLDFYSMNNSYPVRIEFFDNEIDRLCYFDIETQRTIENISDVTCIPATDILFSDDDVKEIVEKVQTILDSSNNDQLRGKIEMDIQYLENHIQDSSLYPYMSFLNKTSHLLEYMGKPNVILSSQEECEESLHHVLEENISYLQEMVQESKWLPKYSIMHDFNYVLRGYPIQNVDRFDDNISRIKDINLPKETVSVQIGLLKKDLAFKRYYFCLKDSEIKQVMDACIEQGVEYHFLQEDVPAGMGINITFASIYEGFECELENLTVITSTELFETRRTQSKYTNKFKNAEVLKSYQDLKPGDYVVHNQHGVGQYMGLETKEVMGIHKDFLKVVYKGNDVLLVPLEQFRLVRKFVSREGVVPKLHKLGSNEWTTTKAKLKENVNNIAERLIQLYSHREDSIGYAYGPDSEYQKDFENDFEYELTPDQKIAIDEVKVDMMKPKPMDRLLCGDVGFGKTEVAIRAAFKAVSENKQVAFLCPTTILARQHAKTFSKRFRNYAVSIELMNRFVSPAKQREVIHECKEGKVDVLIGTHRLLGKDIKFKDLGLLIIDEEQRFGVEHKEKIKELKESVDVLSLSATPIPRTLQMSLIGIRQLSQLETPPDNRVSVQTYVVEKNFSLIKEVIERELARNGQAFYLHNNVEEIYHTARKIQELIPEARVAVAHGQMNKEEIEDVMLGFTSGETNVLVCTTIIETGIDIPNANTILVEHAENFGLSQLYQIKGRVGRSNRLAYAYLMIPSKKQITEIASKRLQAIKDFTQLGSGYKIAMRDLTIRGAGDLLGPEQSGFIDTVGIDMYIEMLEEAIQEKKGIVKKERKEMVKPNVSVDSYIPEVFAPDDFDKISMYQKIDAIETQEELQSFEEKVLDEFGQLPKSVKVLFEKKRLEILINSDDVEKYREVRGQVEIVFSQMFSAHVDGVKLFEIFTTISKDITLRYTDQKIIVKLPKVNDGLRLAIEVLVRSKEAKKNEN
ncbi:transcription-repair coupling factor [Anaerorhabdus sp.]|uniref:transcription-repair coupling factor n=1 Tax=Anaerorhabdus sp. TaxID=1872524 RepID=UPI002FCBB123